MTRSSRFVRLALLAVLTVLFTQSCLSAGASRFRRDAGACQPRPDLVGTWVSTRSSQVGSATLTLRLDCHCRYTMTVAIPVSRVTEEGEYRADDRTIIMSRASKETSWAYELTGGALRMTESADEVHTYSRTKVTRCAE